MAGNCQIWKRNATSDIHDPLCEDCSTTAVGEMNQREAEGYLDKWTRPNIPLPGPRALAVLVG